MTTQDSQLAAASMSEVNASPLFDLKQRSSQVIIFVLVLLFLLIIWGGGKRHHSPKAELLPAASKPSYSSELAANEALLNTIEKSPINEPAPIIAASLTEKIFMSPKKALSKEMIARMNHPLKMYSAGVNAGPASKKEAIPTKMREGALAKANRIAHPDYTIAAGEFILATLETAINSHSPGMIRATVTKPVYAYTGTQALIPAGSRLIGQYVSANMQNQRRVTVIWDRVILPGGVSVHLDSPGSGPLGRAGQRADKIQKHFWARFGDAALLSVIGVTASNAGVSKNDQYNSASAYQVALARSFDEAAKETIAQNQDIKPTLHVHQGSKINVFVARDLSFYDALNNNKE